MATPATAEQLQIAAIHPSLPQRYRRMTRYDVEYNDLQLTIPAFDDQALLPAGVPEGTTVITFQANGVDMQVLSCQSLLALGMTVFKFTLEGERGEGVNDHLWLFRLPQAEAEDDDEEDDMNQFAYFNPRARERRIEVDVMGNPNQRMASEYSLQELGLTPGMKFVYEYDYGTTSTVKMTVLKVEQLDRTIAKVYPTQVLDKLPTAAPLSEDVLTLEELYPDLNKYLLSDNMSYFVLGNWSRANFGFACHDRLLVAPFRFKTMDEYFSLSNEEVAQFPSLDKIATEYDDEDAEWAADDSCSASSHFIIPCHALSPKQEGSLNAAALAIACQRFTGTEINWDMFDSGLYSSRYTPPQWQAKLAELKAFTDGGKHVELFATRFPKTSKALTKGTHWIRVEQARVLLASKGQCKVSMMPNPDKLVKAYRHRFTSLDELFGVIEAAL